MKSLIESGIKPKTRLPYPAIGTKPATNLLERSSAIIISTRWRSSPADRASVVVNPRVLDRGSTQLRQTHGKFTIGELSPVIRVIGFIQVEKSRGGKNNAQRQPDRSIKESPARTKGKEIRKLLNRTARFDTPKGLQRKQLNHFLSPQRFICSLVGFCDPPILPARFIGHIQRSLHSTQSTTAGLRPTPFSFLVVSTVSPSHGVFHEGQICGLFLVS